MKQKHIHVIRYRAFNMSHEIKRFFNHAYGIDEIKAYLHHRHGETATLISFDYTLIEITDSGRRTHDTITVTNPDYTEFRIKTELSNQLMRTR